MKHDPHSSDPAAVNRPRAGLAIVASTLVLVGALAYWAYQREAGGGERVGPPPGSPAPQTTGGSVGTSGSGGPAQVGDASKAPIVAPPALIQELETITGSVDGQELVGRRVDLHVKVQTVPSKMTFWIGGRDNRVLVVLGRDTRSRGERQAGLPPRHGILPVHSGQSAAISGSVQRVPRTEEMHSWQLTEGELREVMDRKLYIRADTVTANGHGTE